MLSREWRCSWSSAGRPCFNYIWVIDKCIAYQGASCIRGFTVCCNTMYLEYICFNHKKTHSWCYFLSFQDMTSWVVVCFIRKISIKVTCLRKQWDYISLCFYWVKTLGLALVFVSTEKWNKKMRAHVDLFFKSWHQSPDIFINIIKAYQN